MKETNKEKVEDPAQQKAQRQSKNKPLKVFPFIFLKKTESDKKKFLK